MDANHDGIAAEHQAPARERQSVQLLLRGGLFLAGVCMALGFLLELVQGTLSERAFEVGAIFASGTLPGDRLMGGGILILALTPAVRVLALLILWAQEKDWRFVAVSVAVIVTLGAAIALGGG